MSVSDQIWNIYYSSPISYISMESDIILFNELMK